MRVGAGGGARPTGAAKARRTDIVREANQGANALSPRLTIPPPPHTHTQTRTPTQCLPNVCFPCPKPSQSCSRNRNVYRRATQRQNAHGRATPSALARVPLSGPCPSLTKNGRAWRQRFTQAAQLPKPAPSHSAEAQILSSVHRTFSLPPRRPKITLAPGGGCPRPLPP